MSARKRKEGQPPKRESKPRRKRYVPIAVVVCIALAVAMALGVLLFSGNKADLETPAVVAGKGSNAQQESSAQKADDFQKLVGRWLRPDGGYIIEIRGFDNKGGLDVSYLNPRPINVSSAEASKSGGVTKVFIELQDVGYPGSTYSLIHDPSRDALLGIYYQAQLGQSFEVVFIRMK
jgi:hypothetical protein